MSYEPLLDPFVVLEALLAAYLKATTELSDSLKVELGVLLRKHVLQNVARQISEAHLRLCSFSLVEAKRVPLFPLLEVVLVTLLKPLSIPMFRIVIASLLHQLFSFKGLFTGHKIRMKLPEELEPLFHQILSHLSG